MSYSVYSNPTGRRGKTWGELKDTAIRAAGLETANGVDVATRTAVGHCMDLHDLVVSKLGAGREKDLRFAGELAKLGLLKRETLLERLKSVDCPDELRKIIAARIAALPYIEPKKSP